jgi:hypothetical protein
MSNNVNASNLGMGSDLHEIMKAAQSPSRSVLISHRGCFLAKSQSPGDQLKAALNPSAGEVVPLRKRAPTRPASPPPQGPRPGTRLPLAAYKAAWGDALAKHGGRFNDH